MCQIELLLTHENVFHESTFRFQTALLNTQIFTVFRRQHKPTPNWLIWGKTMTFTRCHCNGIGGEGGVSVQTHLIDSHLDEVSADSPHRGSALTSSRWASWPTSISGDISNGKTFITSQTSSNLVWEMSRCVSRSENVRWYNFKVQKTRNWHAECVQNTSRQSLDSLNTNTRFATKTRSIWSWSCVSSSLLSPQ